jgi:hypothetical protein
VVERHEGCQLEICARWLLLSIIDYAHRVGRGINSISEAISSRENASTVATVINFQWVEVILEWGPPLRSRSGGS